MNAVVFEHVPVAELPAAWRAKLKKLSFAEVKVRIEAQDAQAPVKTSARRVNPMIGMWQNRSDMADVPAYVREIRKGRFDADSSKP